MKRSVIAGVSAIALAAASTVLLPMDAEARRGGIIGGMSAAEIAGAPYGYYGYGYSSGDPVYYSPAAFGPPPGCVIRPQKAWTGYRWTWRKLRICH